MSARFELVVDHGAADETIDRAVIADQLATAGALRERLDDYGGVILGDEVGAGKTYVTFALLAEALAKDPRKGAVIFVPSGLLKTKWCNQLQDYLRAAMRNRTLAERFIERITPIDRSLRDDGSFDSSHWGRRPARNAIVITTHRVYSHRTSRADQAACLRAAASTIKVGRNIRPRALLRACDVDPDTPVAWADWARPDVLTLRTLAPMTNVLKRYASGERGLGEASRSAVQEVRRRVGKSSLPDAALVVIDEAHNLKSTQSAIYQALMSVLSSRFDALLFLTATPFQLGRRELLTIVDFFRFARAYEGREAIFDERVDTMRRAMDGWVDALDGFGAAWRDLDAEGAARCAALIANNNDPRPEVGNLELRADEAFDRCLAAKRDLQSGMRPFVVRSVRERDHVEHRAVSDEYLSEQTRIPLALVDRLLVELMKNGRTFISSALISACSSWEALLSAAIMEEHRETRTRPILRGFADRKLLGAHPKVAQTVAECLAGVASGEKTLVFVEREQTGRILREALNAQLDDAMPDGSEAPSSAALRQRLQDRSRFGWPSLRENYLHTIFPLVFHRDPDRSEISAAWADSRTRELWARVDPAIEKRNYVVEKQLLGAHPLVRACARTPRWPDGIEERLRASVENLIAPEYILNGLDLKSGAARERLPIPETPERAGLPRTAFSVRRSVRRLSLPLGCRARRTSRRSGRTIEPTSSMPRRARSQVHTSARSSRRLRSKATQPPILKPWRISCSIQRALAAPILCIERGGPRRRPDDKSPARRCSHVGPDRSARKQPAGAVHRRLNETGHAAERRQRLQRRCTPK